MTITGTVYLLHFNQSLGSARHYIGFTTNLPARLAAHRRGHSAAIMQALHSAEIEFVLARTWTGTIALERRLKRLHQGSALCPLCNPNAHTLAND
jgi:predicted GIY-YIG superfamily endonuclease